MNACALLSEVTRVGVRLSVRGDRLHVEARAGVITPAMRDRLAAAKPELLAILSATDLAARESARAVVNFRFPTDPPRAWATCLGAPGESRAKIIADLRARWPNVEIQG